MNFSLNKSPQGTILSFSGELAIQNISGIKDALTDASDESGNLIIDHNSAEEFDFAYLQLLHACAVERTLAGKQLNIMPGSPEEFSSLVKYSGLNNISSLFKEIIR